MNVSVKKVGPCRQQLEIEIDATAVSEQYQDLVSDYARRASLPGFRKGKAPLKMVQNHFAKDLKEDVMQRIVSKGYQDAVKQEELDIAAIVDLQDEDFDPGKAFKFTVVVDVEPEFKPPSYKGIKITKENIEPTDEQVDGIIKSILEQYASFAEVTDRGVLKGDMVKIDYTATIDGKPLDEICPDHKELASKEDYWIIANESAFIPEMQDALEGCVIDQEKDVETTFGANFPASELAGRKAVYHVRVKSIRGKQIPEMSEMILKEYNAESEQALRDDIGQRVLESAEDRERSRQIDEICSHLLKKTKIEVPESRVQNEMEAIMRNMMQRRVHDGASPEDMEKNKDAIIEESNRMAAERVKLSYIIDKIAEEEKVEIGDDDLNEHFETQAKMYGISADQYRSTVEERSSIEKVKTGLLAERTLDLLLKQAVVK